MKIVFMGTGEFAVPTLQGLHQAGHEVLLVVSQPDRPQGRGLALRPTPVKAAAVALNLPVFQPEKLRLESGPVIDARADILVVVAYGQILRENVLECAPRGALNVHASLLPKYRGAAPIQWALANGESMTGVTTMQLDRGMDTGPILLQRECSIEPDETTASLEPRLAAMGSALLLETLDGLASGAVVAKAQDSSLATHAPLIKKSESVIDFNRTAHDIAHRLRGFSPWPGVQFPHHGRSVKIVAAKALLETSTAPIATLIAITREGIDVACGSGSVLRLLRVQPESRSAISAFDFANGLKLKPGASLGIAADPTPESRSPQSTD